jgi:serine/threonine protein kinase
MLEPFPNVLLTAPHVVLFSITEEPYENGNEEARYKHKFWLVPSKFNIALVTDTKNDKKVVLKLTANKPDFDHELEFLKALNNSIAGKFVVELKDSFVLSEGSSELRCCIVMERLGDNLHDFLSNNRDLNEPTRVALALELVKAVEALHRERVIHGDLKPHQLCFTRQPGIIALKLVDFDSARRMQLPVAPLDRLTPMYAAPEVVRADAEGYLSTFAPTRGVESWPLGLMLAQIFHSDMEAIFSNDEEAQEVLLGDDPMAIVKKRIKNSRESIWRAVEGLLQMNPRER